MSVGYDDTQVSSMPPCASKFMDPASHKCALLIEKKKQLGWLCWFGLSNNCAGCFLFRFGSVMIFLGV